MYSRCRIWHERLCPPTWKQEQLITKLTKDFPEAKELGEYSDYKGKPTKANASVFITRALEGNWSQVQQSDGYMKYIATRPRAERLGDHGLFGDEETVNLEQAMQELDQYNGNVWTHILSLKREDAARLGYDNAKAWRNLLRANRNEVAAAMNIQPNHFRWYAAFHDEGKHPHIHMMAWSTQPGEAYLTRDGIRNIKSTLTNQIFKQEATDNGIEYSFIPNNVETDVHPNTVDILMVNEEGQEMTIRGESLGGGKARLCRINGVEVDFTGEYSSIVVVQKDAPGVVAYITKCLSELGINIAFMRLFRESKGNTAYTIVESDDLVPEDIADTIRRNKNVYNVMVVQM